MKVEINGYVTCTQYSWDDKPTYSFHAFDPTPYDSNTVIVMKHGFEVEIPDNFDPRPGQVAALKAQRDKLEAEFSKRVMEINNKINSLLALEA
jgi:hypothetical protein